MDPKVSGSIPQPPPSQHQLTPDSAKAAPTRSDDGMSSSKGGSKVSMLIAKFSGQSTTPPAKSLGRTPSMNKAADQMLLTGDQDSQKKINVVGALEEFGRSASTVQNGNQTSTPEARKVVGDLFRLGSGGSSSASSSSSSPSTTVSSDTASPTSDYKQTKPDTTKSPTPAGVKLTAGDSGNSSKLTDYKEVKSGLDKQTGTSGERTVDGNKQKFVTLDSGVEIRELGEGTNKVAYSVDDNWVLLMAKNKGAEGSSEESTALLSEEVQTLKALNDAGIATPNVGNAEILTITVDGIERKAVLVV